MTDTRGSGCVWQPDKHVMKKIDWTKPIRFLNSEADYVGRTHSKCRPNVVATMPTVNEHCDLYLVDDFGCDRSGAQIVTNAPEPKRVYRDVWVNIYPPNPLTGEPLHGYAHPSRKAADKAFGIGRRIACVKLPDFMEEEGLE